MGNGQFGVHVVETPEPGNTRPRSAYTSMSEDRILFRKQQFLSTTNSSALAQPALARDSYPYSASARPPSPFQFPRTCGGGAACYYSQTSFGRGGAGCGSCLVRGYSMESSNGFPGMRRLGQKYNRVVVDPNGNRLEEGVGSEHSEAGWSSHDPSRLSSLGGMEPPACCNLYQNMGAGMRGTEGGRLVEGVCGQGFSTKGAQTVPGQWIYIGGGGPNGGRFLPIGRDGRNLLRDYGVDEGIGGGYWGGGGPEGNSRGGQRSEVEDPNKNGGKGKPGAGGPAGVGNLKEGESNIFGGRPGDGDPRKGDEGDPTKIGGGASQTGGGGGTGNNFGGDPNSDGGSPNGNGERGGDPGSSVAGGSPSGYKGPNGYGGDPSGTGGKSGGGDPNGRQGDDTTGNGRGMGGLPGNNNYRAPNGYGGDPNGRGGASGGSAPSLVGGYRSPSSFQPGDISPYRDARGPGSPYGSDVPPYLTASEGSPSKLGNIGGATRSPNTLAGQGDPSADKPGDGTVGGSKNSPGNRIKDAGGNVGGDGGRSDPRGGPGGRKKKEHPGYGLNLFGDPVDSGSEVEGGDPANERGGVGGDPSGGGRPGDYLNGNRNDGAGNRITFEAGGISPYRDARPVGGMPSYGGNGMPGSNNGGNGMPGSNNGGNGGPGSNYGGNGGPGSNYGGNGGPGSNYGGNGRPGSDNGGDYPEYGRNTINDPIGRKYAGGDPNRFPGSGGGGSRFGGDFNNGNYSGGETTPGGKATTGGGAGGSPYGYGSSSGGDPSGRQGGDSGGGSGTPQDLEETGVNTEFEYGGISPYRDYRPVGGRKLPPANMADNNGGNTGSGFGIGRLGNSNVGGANGQGGDFGGGTPYGSNGNNQMGGSGGYDPNLHKTIGGDPFGGGNVGGGPFGGSNVGGGTIGGYNGGGSTIGGGAFGGGTNRGGTIEGGTVGGGYFGGANMGDGTNGANTFGGGTNRGGTNGGGTAGGNPFGGGIGIGRLGSSTGRGPNDNHGGAFGGAVPYGGYVNNQIGGPGGYDPNLQNPFGGNTPGGNATGVNPNTWPDKQLGPNGSPVGAKPGTSGDPAAQNTSKSPGKSGTTGSPKSSRSGVAGDPDTPSKATDLSSRRSERRNTDTFYYWRDWRSDAKLKPEQEPSTPKPPPDQHQSTQFPSPLLSPGSSPPNSKRPSLEPPPPLSPRRPSLTSSSKPYSKTQSGQRPSISLNPPPPSGPQTADKSIQTDPLAVALPPLKSSIPPLLPRDRWDNTDIPYGAAGTMLPTWWDGPLVHDPPRLTDDTPPPPKPPPRKPSLTQIPTSPRKIPSRSRSTTPPPTPPPLPSRPSPPVLMVNKQSVKTFKEGSNTSIVSANPSKLTLPSSRRNSDPSSTAATPSKKKLKDTRKIKTYPEIRLSNLPLTPLVDIQSVINGKKASSRRLQQDNSDEELVTPAPPKPALSKQNTSWWDMDNPTGPVNSDLEGKPSTPTKKGSKSKSKTKSAEAASSSKNAPKSVLKKTASQPAPSQQQQKPSNRQPSPQKPKDNSKPPPPVPPRRRSIRFIGVPPTP